MVFVQSCTAILNAPPYYGEVKITIPGSQGTIKYPRGCGRTLG
jgi:hypothetical protein